jgi:hypothetical protein
MSQVIRVTDEIYKRLEAHASGFVTPSEVIENILNAYEGITPGLPSTHEIDREMEQSNNLEIVFPHDTEAGFKQALLSHKKAYIRLHFTDGTTEIKPWRAHGFSETSSVKGNLRSGQLRGWKSKGITKAELSVSHDKFGQRHP